jgi:hypothetical protein
MAKLARVKEIELEPDAWSRFERAVDVVAKSPPQHRPAKGKRKQKRRKSPAKSGKKKPGK